MDNLDNLNTYNSNYRPMTLGDWVVTLIIQAIPLVGFIMLFVWAFGGGTHPSKKTWAQASLIIFAVVIVLMIIFFGVLMSMFGSMLSGAYQQGYSS